MILVRPLLLFWLALLPLAFTLHLGWEYAQCQAFFVHGAIPATPAAMLRATLGDLVLTALAYAGVAAITRNAAWGVERWTRRVWISLLGFALSFSIALELMALVTGRWSYTASALRLPMTSVSIVPVLQLVILFPISFALARLATRCANRGAGAL